MEPGNNKYSNDWNIDVYIYTEHTSMYNNYYIRYCGNHADHTNLYSCWAHL